MLTIKLKDLNFRGFHGLYPEERILGGNFVVNLEVEYQPQPVIIQEIWQTLDYERLFEMVKARMALPTPLLETIAMELTAEILQKFQHVSRVSVEIEKKNPPIPGLSGSVVVAYSAFNQ